MTSPLAIHQGTLNAVSAAVMSDDFAACPLTAAVWPPRVGQLFNATAADGLMAVRGQA